jgi:hypothetical protein
MKSLLRGFVAAGIIVFAFAAAQTGNRQAVTQKTPTQIPKPIPILKPDYTAEIRVTLEPSITSTKLVKNFGSYINGPATCWMLIRNDGLGDATKASKFKYIVSLDDKVIKTVEGTVPNGIKKGEYFSISYEMPAGKFGKWHFWIGVDTADDISESNEGNNSRFHECTCQKLY